MSVYLFRSLVLVTILQGCANLQPTLSVQVGGEVDMQRDSDLALSAAELEPSAVTQVSLKQGVIPKGLKLTENGQQLKVLTGYESRYEILGTAQSELQLRKLTVNNFYGAFKEEGWKKPYCYAQVPFKIVTLGMWTIIPFHYPCYRTLGNESKRRSLLHESLKRGAAVMGGNLVLLISEGSTIVVSSESIDTSEATSMVGFVVRDHGPSAFQ